MPRSKKATAAEDTVNSTPIESTAPPEKPAKKAKTAKPAADPIAEDAPKVTRRPAKAKAVEAPETEAPKAKPAPKAKATAKTEPTPEPKTRRAATKKAEPVQAAKPEPRTIVIPDEIESLPNFKLTFRKATPGDAPKETPRTSNRRENNRREDNRRDNERSRSEKPAKPVVRRTVSVEDADGDWRSEPPLPVPSWRPATGGAAAKARLRDEETDHDEDETPIERPQPRNARRSEAKPEPKTEQPKRFAAKVEAPAPKDPPKPQRENIAIPDDAPQVTLLNTHPVISINKTAIPPLMLHLTAPDERRLATVLEEVKLATESGIHLYSIKVELDVDPNKVNDAAGAAGYFIKKITEVDPDAQVILRTDFYAVDGWEQIYKKARYLDNEGLLAEPSIADDDFWAVAEECLTLYTKRVLGLPVADHIVGIHLDRGDWFYPERGGYDTSVAAHEGFRKWLRARYRDDIPSLRAAWFDGSCQFDTISIPEEQRRSGRDESFVRIDRKDRRWVDYHLCLADMTCDRISKLAYAVKKASEGRLLVGVSYGYTFEWSHPGSGHLSLGKLLRCPDIDYIGGPPSYGNREPGDATTFPGPIDSFALNNKLPISEEDFKTPISGRSEPDEYNPVIKTPQALSSVHWRGAGVALAHGGGLNWMDSWGNGWLNSPSIWQRADQIKGALTMRIAAPQTAPDVALLVDERSLAYLADKDAFDILVRDVRQALVRSGLSVGYYLLSDLAHREHFPESRLYIFVNAWDIRPEVRSAIKTRLQRDGKVLFWLYAAGLFEGGRESLERVREVTGFALRPQPFNSRSGTTLLNNRDPLCTSLPQREIAEGGRLQPSYYAIPEKGIVLGEYSHSGLPSYVIVPFEDDPDSSKHWYSIFLGEPIVTPTFFRELGKLAECHVWAFDEDALYVRPPFLTLHCKGTGPRTLSLPDLWRAYNLTEGEWAVVENKTLRFNALDGQTYTFLVGTQGDIEGLLNTDPQSTLRIKDIAHRNEPEKGWNAMELDVPIMQLGEWVEQSWSEDLADDLLLKPSLIDIDRKQEEATEEQEADRPGNRRRRRRRRRGGEEGSDNRCEGSDRINDETIAVVFRKRD